MKEQDGRALPNVLISIKIIQIDRMPVLCIVLWIMRLLPLYNAREPSRDIPRVG